jgi:MoxR-like ATPase
MATKASLMKVGDTYTVGRGEHAGKVATILDATPFPDTDMARRRKITVDIDGNTAYILPRVLDVPSYMGSASTARRTNAPVPTLPSFVPGAITSVDDPRLDPWRPDPSVVKRYVSRTLPNGMRDTEFLMKLWHKRRNVMLVGDTQAGKTMLVEVMAVLIGRERGTKPLPVFTLSGSAGVTDFDLFGQPVTSPDGTDRLVFLAGLADMAARAGGIFYVDEVNLMSERVTSSLHSLFDSRKSFVNRQKAVRYAEDGVDGEAGVEVFMPEVVKGSDDLWVFGTINPSGYKGTSSMNEAFSGRFTHVPWGYDEAVEKKLIPSAAVRLLGQAVRDARSNRALTTPIGTATLVDLCENIDDFGIETGLWMFTAMFQPQEVAKVDAIITDRSIEMLLRDEQLAKETPVEEASIEQPTDGTVWNGNPITSAIGSTPSTDPAQTATTYTNYTAPTATSPGYVTLSEEPF